jgi:hypothetical protein
MARVSHAQLRKIAPRGKKALRARIDALRERFPDGSVEARSWFGS